MATKNKIMKQLSHKVGLILFLSLLTVSCTNTTKNTITIAISKGNIKHYSRYHNWLKNTDSTINCKDMYHYLSIDSAVSELEECSALLLSGGADIYPGRYGKEKDSARCGSFDLKRDSLEIALIKKALSLNMPILGICRGMQILNVSQGGTLIIDIPTDYDTTVKHRLPNYTPIKHAITIDTLSLLYKTAKIARDTVVSNHHQGVEKLADCFKTTGITSDNLPEVIEWKKRNKKSFLLGVQFHPERADWKSPITSNIAKTFLKEASKYQNNKK